MNQRELALAYIRREVEESGELTVFALRKAQEHRISYQAMITTAREGMRRRTSRSSSPNGTAAPEPANQASSPSTPMSPQNRITEAEAQIASIRADLRRHEQLLADAKRSGMAADEVQRIETLVANDHAFIASWERQIAEEEQAASDPALIALRRQVDALSFEDCVLSLISRDGAGPLSVPMKTSESLTKLRDHVFEEARRGRLTLLTVEAQPGAARRLPIVLIDGKPYYRDDRLREYRAVDNPHDRQPL